MYPENVQEISEKVYDCLKKEIVEMTNYDPGWFKPICIEHISKLFLEKWLKGEELYLEAEEAKNLFKEIVFILAIESLKKKGLIDTIENENNEKIIFLTKEGKETREKLKNKK